jgi:Mn-dependent DtxR family transcriptional regulator
LTPAFLAEMLGVQRTSVSLVVGTLQAAGIISYRRGHVQINDLDGLRDSACECYETIRSHFERSLDIQLH